MLDYLLEGLQVQTAKNVIRTYIQCIASIWLDNLHYIRIIDKKNKLCDLYKFICSRQAGHRFGEQIERVMPLIVQYSNEDDDELREYCLQAFESFVYRCPKEITPHINKVHNSDPFYIIGIMYIYVSYVSLLLNELFFRS